MNRFRPLLWPGAVLIVGLLGGWGAETAVARYENYALYGIARPVADLLLIIGAVWAAAAVAQIAPGRRRRR